jgi:methionyl aminopeptidase
MGRRSRSVIQNRAARQGGVATKPRRAGHKSDAEIDLMREAGRVVAAALDAIRRSAAVGSNLLEMDELAETVIRERGGEPLFKNYHPRWSPTPFPGTICASVNDVVVHGIPTREPLVEGDLVSIDCGARIDGWCGDAAISFVVGEPNAADIELIETTERALHAGIAAARPGNTMGDVAHAIGAVARGAGYGLLANHGGHGIGREMHEAPSVPNDGEARTGMRLHPGLVIALEPMVIAGGGDDYRVDRDGWTIRTADGSRAAHAEHTVAVTPDGPRILTLP